MVTKKVVISGVIIWLVSTIIGMLTCGKYFSWVYEIPPQIWKTPAEIMTKSSMITANLLGLISGILFAMVFVILAKSVPGEGMKKGAIYGVLIWLVGAFAGIATMPVYMTIATQVVIYWLIQSLIINIINGAIVATICKK
jgi:hypothetical protein